MPTNPYESRSEEIEKLAKAFETEAALRRHHRAGNERLEQTGFASSWTRKVLISPEAREKYNKMIERGEQEFRRRPDGKLPEDMIVLVGERIPDSEEQTLYTVIESVLSIEDVGGERRARFAAANTLNVIRLIEERWQDKEMVGMFHTHPLTPTHKKGVWGVESWLAPGDKKLLRDFDATCPGFVAGLAVPGTSELTLAYWDKERNDARNIARGNIKVESPE